jgi:hypothetical protein
MPLTGIRQVSYWSEEGRDRTELLDRAVAYLDEHRWGKVIDAGWSDWDLEIYCHPWAIVKVCTSQEDHAGGRRLIRVRYRLRPNGCSKEIGVLAAVAVALGTWPAALAAALLLSTCVGTWWFGTRRASRVMALFDLLASQMGAIRCEPAPGPVRAEVGESASPEVTLSCAS